MLASITRVASSAALSAIRAAVGVAMSLCAFAWSLVPAKVQAAFADFMTEHRGWFVVFFVLPLSLAFDGIFAIRAWVVMKFYSAPELHEKRVKDVQDQIQKWRADPELMKAKPRLCTARGGWQSISPGFRTYKSKSYQVSVDMYDILGVEKDAKHGDCVVVEPMVNMGQLSHFLTPLGFTIPVLPEMDDLTVGGLIMGVGIETSSHKYGLFNDSVVEMVVVTADGEVVKCSRTENRDLFDALPWSYGTLGFLVSAKIKVVPCKEFVRMQYVPCYAKADLVRVFSDASCAEEPHDFVEALAYGKNRSVVILSDFCSRDEMYAIQSTSNLNPKVNSIGLWYKPWFYKHVESFMQSASSMLNFTREELEMVSGKSPVHEEFIPLRHYYHRHTKSIFWELEQIIPIGHNPIFRLLLGWAVPPKVSFLKLTQTEALRELYEKQHVIQDMLVPVSKMSEALEVFDDKYDLYPLWVCPYRAYDYSKADKAASHRSLLKKPLNLQKGKDYEMYVDLGAYGIPRSVLEKRPFDAVKSGRAVEVYVESVRGFQMLYADSYMNEEEFRTMFDHAHYDAMKAKYDPSSCFPTVFQKTCKKAKKTWDAMGESKKRK